MRASLRSGYITFYPFHAVQMLKALKEGSFKSIMEEWLWMRRVCLGWMQDPQQVKDFPRAFRGKVRSVTQRRKQRAEEVMGLLEFAESHACLHRLQVTAALRIQNPRLWLEYTQNRSASCVGPFLHPCLATG